MTLQDIEKQALSLPPADRERLATRLLESVDRAPDEEIDDATLAEWDRRYEELRAYFIRV